MISGDEKDYERLLCSICVHNAECNKEKINIHDYGDSLTMNCIDYKYENSPLI